MNGRSGFLKRQLSKDAAYFSFVPAKLPPEPTLDLSQDLLANLMRAKQVIAALEAVSIRIPNIQLFLSMYIRKEALLSSQIEGTQATLEDVLDPYRDENVNRDVKDVINYIQASEYALKRLQELPLCNRFLKEVHGVLMQGVRGQEKSPGEFRRSQNWIGGQGSVLKNARYIPPHPDDMIEAMSDLEKFMNDENVELDELIKVALIHYQFETIHPFLDGNGRVGRLLITLYLLEKQVLSQPVLYVSYFLKNNRIEYYDRMMEVREKGTYEQWVRFFLLAIERAATDALHVIDLLHALRIKDEQKISDSFKRPKTALQIYQSLLSQPIITIQGISEALHVSYNTASTVVKKFVELGILVQNEVTKRNRTFAYEAYLEILKRGM